MKKITLLLGFVMAICLMAFVGCQGFCSNHVDSDKDGKCDNCGKAIITYSVEISTEDLVVYEGGTLKLSANKTPAEAVITWASGNEKIATVAQDGTVTGIKAGEVTITATVKKGVSSEVTVTVKAPEVSIEALETNYLYVTQTMQLKAKVLPQGAHYTWESSNEEIATVSETGLLTAIKAGEVTLTVALNETLKESVTVTVRDTVINAAVNAENFDFSGIYREDAIVKSNGAQNSYAVFNGVAGKYYVATATAKVTAPDAGDTWSRVGISHFNGTNSYYGLQLSPGPDYGARKTVTMIITDGNVQWGAITDRSQVWHQHQLGAINFDRVKLTAVRQGNKYYAYVNDKLYYYDEGMDGFDDIDTLPVLNLGSCVAEYTAISATYGEDAVNAFLATADKSAFYASFDNQIIEQDGTIKFINANNTNPKDHAVKAIGAMAMLYAGVEGKVEFDLTIDGFGSSAMPALAVTINRYDQTPAEARSLIIAQNKAGWTGWNSNGNLNEGIGDGGRTYSLNGEETRLEEGKTYHVVFTRLMFTDGQDTKLQIKDAEGNVLLEYAHGWHDGYSGRVVVNFLNRDLNCTITNLSISSQQA